MAVDKISRNHIESQSTPEIVSKNENVTINFIRYSISGDVVTVSANYHVTAALSNNDVLFAVAIPVPAVIEYAIARAASNNKYGGLNIGDNGSRKLQFQSAGTTEVGNYYTVSICYVKHV